MKTILNQNPKLAKSGLEVGLLSIAVLLVLFFALLALRQEKGVAIPRLTPKLGIREPSEKSVIVKILSDGTVEYGGIKYSSEEFAEHILGNPLEQEKVFYLRISAKAEFGKYISIQDSLISSGVPQEHVYLGGVEE